MKQHINLKQAGFTVVELMVGLLLSLLLVAGVLQVYLGSQTTYQVTEGLSRLQENTRTSAELLAKEIRMAGYIPCSQPEQATSIVDNTDWWTALFEQPIRGFEGEAGTSSFPSELTTSGTKQAKVGSDAIIILRAGANVAGVELYDAANQQFVLQRDAPTNWFQAGSLMVACDSTNARLFQSSSISANRITVADKTLHSGLLPNNVSPISRNFGTDSQIASYSAVIYFISEASSGNGYSLYRRYLNVVGGGNNEISAAEELAEGIENMQLLYGYDGDGDGNAERYLKADDGMLTGANVDNWRNIASVKIGLLYASEDRLREGEIDNNVYVVANTQIGTSTAGTTVTHAQDQRKRYVASMTVSLRNL